MSERNIQFPVRLADIFEKLKSEVIWLHGQWIIYRQLFGTSEERINLLNDSAPLFFFVAHGALLDQVQLTLSKLNEPAKTQGHKNLTIAALVEIIEQEGFKKLTSDLKSIQEKFKEKCNSLIKRRNKKLAHFDFETLMAKGENPLPEVSRKMIEAALMELRSFMNRVDAYFGNSETYYQNLILSNDGNTLIEILKRGLRYEELCQNQTISFEDLFQSKYYEA